MYGPRDEEGVKFYSIYGKEKSLWALQHAIQGERWRMGIKGAFWCCAGAGGSEQAANCQQPQQQTERRAGGESLMTALRCLTHFPFLCTSSCYLGQKLLGSRLLSLVDCAHQYNTVNNCQRPFTGRL